MNLNRIALLREYINGNYAPILTEDVYESILPEYGQIDINNIENDLNILIDNSGNEKIPEWINKANETKLLVIRHIDLLAKEKQKLLIELLKSKKVGNIELNKDVIIIATCEILDLTKIDEEIISLTIQTI